MENVHDHNMCYNRKVSVPGGGGEKATPDIVVRDARATFWSGRGALARRASHVMIWATVSDLDFLLAGSEGVATSALESHEQVGKTEQAAAASWVT